MAKDTNPDNYNFDRDKIVPVTLPRIGGVTAGRGYRTVEFRDDAPAQAQEAPPPPPISKWGKQWAPEELAKLVQLRDAGTPWDALATIFGRTPVAVEMACVKYRRKCRLDAKAIEGQKD